MKIQFKNDYKVLLDIMKNFSYKEIFKAVVSYEIGDFDYDITEEDEDFINKVFDKFMQSKTCSGLINEEINEIIEELK